MTIISACRKDGLTAIGSDSQATAGDHIANYGPKMHKYPGHVIAYCGSFLLDNILECYLPHPKSPQCKADVIALAAIIRQEMIQNGSQEKSTDWNDLQHSVGMIVATPMKIWSIHGNYSVLEHSPQRGITFAALGSGQDYAYAVASVAAKDNTAESIVRHALTAACRCSASCGGKLHVMTVTR